MGALEGIHPALQRRVRAAADWLRDRRAAGETVTVVHHIDADGITGGAIALEALERAGIPTRSLEVKSLDDVHLEKIRAAAPEAVWCTDLGSAAYMDLPDVPLLVCDHHELVRDGTEETFAHVNPLLDDLPGSSISGAGTTFLVAHALDAANLDLLPVALVGAAADLQDRDGGFHGVNRSLVQAGQALGTVQAGLDLAWYGPHIRPLRKFLAYGDDPVVPGITGDRRAVEALFSRLDIPLTAEGTERTWGHLNEAERRRVRSALVTRVLRCGLGPDHAMSLFAERIELAAEEVGTPVREVQGFGTLLNSTARYGHPEVGLAVARGDRDRAYKEAVDLLTGHRRHLVGALDAFATAGVTEATGVQWVHLQDRVRDTVVGIVCGMALDGLGLRRDLALVGFAHTPDGRTKVSSRAPPELQGRIDLAAAMRAGAEAVGGQGGGHPGAAGATIPRGAEETFLAVVDKTVAGQLRRC